MLQVGTLRPECLGPHSVGRLLTPSPVPFPQGSDSRGPPCEHCPHFQVSLKLPSSMLFEVRKWQNLLKMTLGDIGKVPSELKPSDTQSALQRHLLAGSGIALVPCSV